LGLPVLENEVYSHECTVHCEGRVRNLREEFTPRRGRYLCCAQHVLLLLKPAPLLSVWREQTVKRQEPPLLMGVWDTGGMLCLLKDT